VLLLLLESIPLLQQQHNSATSPTAPPSTFSHVSAAAGGGSFAIVLPFGEDILIYNILFVHNVKSIMHIKIGGAVGSWLVGWLVGHGGGCWWWADFPTQHMMMKSLIKKKKCYLIKATKRDGWLDRE
jgi:hypothetical protein